MTTLPIDKIKTDDQTQSRAMMDAGTIDEYSEAMLEGAEFPPIDVFFDGSDHWVADGFHRITAARRVGRTEINVTLHEGGLREAILYSVGVNASHGLRRNNSDKRRAVTRLLRDPEWSQWSDREIARRCCVSNRFVSNLRGFVAPDPSVNGSQIARKVERNGTTFTMSTANIGQDKTVMTRCKWDKCNGNPYNPNGFTVPDDTLVCRNCGAKHYLDGVDRKLAPGEQQRLDQAAASALPVWALERRVSEWFDGLDDHPANNPQVILNAIKDKTPSGKHYLSDIEIALNGANYKKSDLIQACNNMWEQRRQQAEREQREVELSQTYVLLGVHVTGRDLDTLKNLIVVSGRLGEGNTGYQRVLKQLLRQIDFCLENGPLEKV